ncbi:hypothetical protein [Streptomyces sp. NPDC052701]|uniref:hypothetical protein n=1 Tax=Streptomyces sp. NPDC052701 TaxID=3155533 RepID=UPI0034263A06
MTGTVRDVAGTVRGAAGRLAGCADSGGGGVAGPVVPGYVQDVRHGSPRDP